MLTINNNGTTKLENSTLTFDIISGVSTNRSLIITDSQNFSLAELTTNKPYILNPLSPGQNQTVFGYVEDNIVDDSKINGSLLIATLRSGNNILNRANITLDLQIPNYNLMNYTSAKIVEISPDNGFYPIGGVTIYLPFYVTITNTGLFDINGSTLTIQNIGTTSVSQGTYIGGVDIPLLHAYETYKTESGVFPDLNHLQEAKNLIYQFALSLNGTILDTKTTFHG